MNIFRIFALFDWIYVISLVVAVFEIGNIIFRKIKKKPIKWHLLILLGALVIISLWFLEANFPAPGDPDW